MHTDGCFVPTGLATREPKVLLDSGLAASSRPGMTSGET